MVSVPAQDELRASDRGLRGRDRRRLAEAELLDRGLAHLELLDLAGDGHRETVDELPVPGDLVGRDLALAPRRELLACSVRALTQFHPGHDLLAILLGGHADNLH